MEKLGPMIQVSTLRCRAHPSLSITTESVSEIESSLS